MKQEVIKDGRHDTTVFDMSLKYEDVGTEVYSQKSDSTLIRDFSDGTVFNSNLIFQHQSLQIKLLC